MIAREKKWRIVPGNLNGVEPSFLAGPRQFGVGALNLRVGPYFVPFCTFDAPMQPTAWFLPTSS
jgi:hypothetical protein